MSELFRDSDAAWAALIIVAIPLLIITAGELEERLRQRDSPYQSAITTLRLWVVPLSTVWVLARVLLDVAGTNIFVRFLGTAAIVSASLAALSALRVIVAELIDRPARTGRRPIPRLLLALPRLLLILTTLWLLIAGVWGVDLSAALTALGVTSLVISFALQDTLSGIASGFTLLADQPFGTGDWIESGDIEGRVIDVNWRSTRIQNRNGDLVVIPNGQLANATIVNFDQPSRLHRVTVDVQIDRSAPPTKAIEMLLDAARSTPGVVTDPAPFARVTLIADPVVDYQASMWIDDYANAPQVKADFAALVWYLTYRHDVPLPNPAQDVFVFDGAKAAIEAKITTDDIRERIADMPLVAGLDDDALDHMASLASLGRYRTGETIVEEGSQHDLWLMHRGRARLVVRRDAADDLDILDIEAGEVFGVLDEPPGSGRALILAATDCEVVRIPPDGASRAIALAPDLANVLDQLATTRRRRIERVLRRAGDSTAAGNSATRSDLR